MNSRKNYWNLVFSIIGVLAVAGNFMRIYDAYLEKNNFRIVLSIVLLIFFMYWTISYFIKWRKHRTGENNEAGY